MKSWKDITGIFGFDTLGGIAASGLLICTFSGVLLAIPYDVSNAYKSVSSLMLANPPAAFIRNLHYWSAQVFLVFTVLHIFDHFIRRTERNLGRFQWVLLSLALGVVFYAMISGFMLKGDPDALQAHRILSSLMLTLPWLGEYFRFSLLGSETDFQLLYVHHVATATLILVILTYNHAGRIFSGGYPFTIVFFTSIILSFFFHAPLHDGYHAVMKGPWYFLGLQEMLHWMPRPGIIWLLPLITLIAFILIREAPEKLKSYLKVSLLVLTVAYLVLTAIGAFFRGENWEWTHPLESRADSPRGIVLAPVIPKGGPDTSVMELIPYINNRAEGCLVCHDGMNGFSASHDPEAIGCSSCHGGNPFALDKRVAHRAMILHPGSLPDAARSCGTAGCHPGIPARVDHSIMTTASGIVSIDRYVFGASDSLSVLSHIRDLGHDAADQHLRDLCANCHLGMPRQAYGPVTALSRGGGCIACHLNYSEPALAELNRFVASPEDFDHQFHPSLSLAVTDEHCFGCHSRSGRISLSYRGLHETLYGEDDIPPGHLKLEDKRVMKILEDDIHHRGGMLCIDCHISRELMGDGNLYRHKEEQVKIRCADCHKSVEPVWVEYSRMDEESRKIVQVRYGEEGKGRSYLKLGGSEDHLLNVWKGDGEGMSLHRKADGKVLPMRPPAPVCLAGDAHDALSCESCHTLWVPQCIGCHNEYDPHAESMDLLERKDKQGSWVEFVAKFFHDPPVLGVRETPGEDAKEVITFTPGMILSIALETYPGARKNEIERFHRLYAPISAHTTSSQGRDCNSCHLDPLAIGYGRGKLEYVMQGNKVSWEFTPRFALNPNDLLPEDAWTGFLQPREDQAATRYSMRPFNLEEQKAILTVGACLKCHDQHSEIMTWTLTDYDSLLMQLSEKCILPAW